MITDEKQSELRNLMTPIVNYFCLRKKLLKTNNPSEIYMIKCCLLKEKKVIYGVMPKIKKILKENSH